MKFVMCVFLIFVAVAAAQFGDVYGPGVYGPGALDVQGFAPLSAAVGRDPRQNTGPVVFPPLPPATPLTAVESSSEPQDTDSYPQARKVSSDSIITTDSSSSDLLTTHDHPTTKHKSLVLGHNINDRLKRNRLMCR